MRLKPKEVKRFREKLLREQNFMCPLCGTHIKAHEATLDHDHGTGYIRRVLHRSCNQTEGRILSWIKRSRGTDPVLFIQNLAIYWGVDYSRQPQHPNHKSDLEREIHKLQKGLRKLKTSRGKQRRQDKINKLKEKL